MTKEELENIKKARDELVYILNIATESLYVNGQQTLSSNVSIQATKLYKLINEIEESK